MFSVPETFIFFYFLLPDCHFPPESSQDFSDVVDILFFFNVPVLNKQQ